MPYKKCSLIGGYVWAYSMVLSGIVIGSIYVMIRIQFHAWKTPNDKVHMHCASTIPLEMLKCQFYALVLKFSDC